MTLLNYVFCTILGLAVIFMGFQAIHAGWTRILPISYKVTYCILYSLYVIFTICVIRNCGTNTSELINFFDTLQFMLIIGGMILLLPSVILTRTSSIRKISFKNTLLYGLERKEEKEYQKLTSQEFAEQNNLDYIHVVGRNRIENDEEVERIIAKDNKYIKFYPFNDGYTYSPKKEWFGKFEKNGTVYYTMIMDTKKAFNCITNLKEILMQMLQIYCDNINKDVFIDPYEFALMLEDEPKEGYVGCAKLVVTADTIKNNRIETDEKEKMKKYYLGRMLDCFLGWNFGAVIEENTDLQIKVMLLNDWAITKGLRTQRRIGDKLYFDEYIKPYKLKTKEKCF